MQTFSERNHPGQDRIAEEPIAIIGIGARLPGASDLETFWRNLTAGESSVGPPPPGRPEQAGLPEAGFLSDVAGFDAGFFAITEDEARLMDPMQRLALEAAWHCIEEAGWRASDLTRSETGVFMATGKSDYEECMHKAGVEPTRFLSTGTASSIIANRISFALGLTGPSIALDTACSGSLTALHLAAQAIRDGDCASALVGGVNVILNATLAQGLAHEGTLSPDGRTRSFDAAANGYARGEGVIFLLMKLLGDARADGDHIHGLLLSSAISHGGRANWLTAPNAAAQKDLVAKAWRRAGVAAQSITYLEAHGTGTPLGDAIEFNALRQADDEAAPKPKDEDTPFCMVGSAKPNIGHLEAASGLAGILKVLLSMRHRTIPGNPHLNTPNTMCRIEGTRLRLVRQTRHWHRAKDTDGASWPRRAGVSAFGFGGAYGHAVLEEPPGTTAVAGQERGHVLPVLPVSAKGHEELVRYVRDLSIFAKRQCQADGEPGSVGEPPVMLEDLLYTFQVGRVLLPHRIAFLADTWNSLHDVLCRWLEGSEDPRIISSGKTVSTTSSSDELAMLAVAFTQQWVEGQKRDFSSLYDGRRAFRISAPLYPFSHRRYWFEERDLAGDQDEKESVAFAEDRPEIRSKAGEKL